MSIVVTPCAASGSTVSPTLEIAERVGSLILATRHREEVTGRAAQLLVDSMLARVGN